MSAAGDADSDERIEWLDRLPTVVFLGSRFNQDHCLVSTLRSLGFGIRFQSHSSVTDWLAADSKGPASLVVMDQEQRCSADGASLNLELRMLARRSLRFAILSDFDDPCSPFEALRLGARGFIPASLPAPVVLQALKLMVAGGVFIPLPSLLLLLSRKSRPAIQMTLGHGDSSAIDVSTASAWAKTTSVSPETRDLVHGDWVRAHLMRLLKRLPDKRRR